MSRKHGLLFGAVVTVLSIIITYFVPLKLDERGVEFIKKHEYFMASPYRDAGGVPTIGYGMTYYPWGDSVTMQDSPITKTEADFYLRKLLKDYEFTVHASVKADITQSMYDALVSFSYNVGEDRFTGSRLLKMINENPQDERLKKEFLRWIYVKGKPSRGLIYRREKEIELYFNDPYIFPEREPVVSLSKPDNVKS